MMKDDIVLRHLVFEQGMEVDKVEIEVIEKWMLPTTIREV